MSSEIAKLKAKHDRLKAELGAAEAMKKEISRLVDRVIADHGSRLALIEGKINALDPGAPFTED